MSLVQHIKLTMEDVIWICSVSWWCSITLLCWLCIHQLSGSVPVSERKNPAFQEPWKLDDEDVRFLINFTKSQYLNLVVKQAPCYTPHHHHELNLFAEVLLWLLKLTKSLPYRILCVLFSLSSHQTASQIFYKHLCYYYTNHVNIPRLIVGGVTNAVEVQKLYQIAYDSMDPFYKTLMGEMQDPAGRDRVGVLLNIDATYFDLQGSSDIEWSKFMFYPPRHGSVAKFLNVTTQSGKIVGLLPIATSQSPSSGDAYLTRKFVGLQDDGPSENYLRVLLRGNDRFFVVLVTGGHSYRTAGVVSYVDPASADSGFLEFW